MTLNDFPLFCVILPNSVTFRVHYVKVIENTPIPSASEMLPKECNFSDISFMAIFAENHPNEGVRPKVKLNWSNFNSTKNQP